MINIKEISIGNYLTIDNPKYHPNVKGVPLRVYNICESASLKNNETSYAISLEQINKEANTHYDSYSQLIEFIKPIELSHEMLIKLGFYVEEDLGDMTYYEHKSDKANKRHYAICNNHDEWQLLWITRGGGYCVLIHDESYFQYVHQLQNLWYSLNGVELKFEE